MKINLIDGSLNIDREYLKSCEFFGNTSNFIKSEEYDFNVTIKEFYIIISYITNNCLPKIGNTYSDNVKILSDFLCLEELHDFLLTDSEYFLKYVDSENLKILDDKNIYNYDYLIYYMKEININNENNKNNTLVFNRGHINFYSLKSFADYFINNKDLIDSLEIDWNNTICNCNFPYLFFSDINFYTKDLLKLKNKLIDLGIYIKQNDNSLEFCRNNRKLIFYKENYKDVFVILDKCIDSDSFFYGKNPYSGELGLWITMRKIRFDKYVTNLYDPRYDRKYPKNIPIEFVGSFERNSHIIKNI
jgi:hypothetical protein